MTETTVEIPVSKVLKGVSENEFKDYNFEFKLTNVNGKELEKIQNKGLKEVNFKTLQYKIEDSGKEFIYYIEEVDKKDIGIKYDKRKYKITVKITTNNEGIQTQINKYQIADGKEVKTDKIEFENEFNLVGAPVTGYKDSFIILGVVSSLFVVWILGVRRKFI